MWARSDTSPQKSALLESNLEPRASSIARNLWRGLREHNTAGNDHCWLAAPCAGSGLRTPSGVPSSRLDDGAPAETEPLDTLDSSAADSSATCAISSPTDDLSSLHLRGNTQQLPRRLLVLALLHTVSYPSFLAKQHADPSIVPSATVNNEM